MKTIVELNTNDIATIIAEHFNVDKNVVTVKTEKVSVGYGLAEHDEYLPIAKIEIQQNKEIKK